VGYYRELPVKLGLSQEQAAYRIAARYRGTFAPTINVGGDLTGAHALSVPEISVSELRALFADLEGIGVFQWSACPACNQDGGVSMKSRPVDPAAPYEYACSKCSHAWQRAQAREVP